jgi:hypothetical protein
MQKQKMGRLTATANLNRLALHTAFFESMAGVAVYFKSKMNVNNEALFGQSSAHTIKTHQSPIFHHLANPRSLPYIFSLGNKIPHKRGCGGRDDPFLYLPDY